MDSIRKHLSWVWLLFFCAGLLQGACTAERTAAREVLADPLMRFGPARAIDAPNAPPVRDDSSLPVDTVRASVDMSMEPGSDVQATHLVSGIRTAVGIWAGLGLEAGYGTDLDKLKVFKRDGVADPLPLDRLSHGPDAAIVYDDGTSVLRLGYRYRHAWDGDLHEPSIRARTAVLRRDTVIEVDYRHKRQALQVGSGHHPAEEAVDAKAQSDAFSLALEQGWVPGWNLRLEVLGRVESGFLQDPYRLVSLWSHRAEDLLDGPADTPRSEAERHPGERVRWASMLRLRKAIPAWGSVLELGIGRGSGSWRVEQSRALIGWSQRMGNHVRLGLTGGAYHQTRASFYRDDYPAGPPGAYWSADRSLSSYWAWWSSLELCLGWLAGDGRLMGMFKYIDLRLAGRLLRADYNFEGLDSANGFTDYADEDFTDRQVFDGAWVFGGLFVFEAGF
ncbi:MAG: DUF3570 domain-containing protein [Deltaproteobacteria bacterium]|nr:DUF3570 domain-containing protein [Deltaproteobacteria bacterium]